MNKKESKKICKEIIDDINALQKNPLVVNFVQAQSLMNLYVFRTKLNSYLESDTFPKEYDFPPYDLSALADNPMVNVEFKHLHKEKSEEQIEFVEDFHLHVQSGAEEPKEYSGEQ